jgi:hypothetical protein
MKANRRETAAAELLAAEEAYKDAAARHEAEHTDATREALTEAHERLELAAALSRQVARGELLN